MTSPHHVLPRSSPSTRERPAANRAEERGGGRAGGSGWRVVGRVAGRIAGKIALDFPPALVSVLGRWFVVEVF